MSEGASPVQFVPKKDGRGKFCVDYRKINAMTVRDTYPFPRTDESTDLLGDTVMLSTVECAGGYWQSKILETDGDKPPPRTTMD